MPIYEYCCEECGHVFEEWQSGFEEKKFPCPICNGESKRIVSHTSFVLKGTGWYATDYCNKHTSPNSGNGNTECSQHAAGESSASASATPPTSAPVSSTPKTTQSTTSSSVAS
jgi:putative FmdB family regulatory protein